MSGRVGCGVVLGALAGAGLVLLVLLLAGRAAWEVLPGWALPSLPTLPPLVLPTPAPTATPKIITGAAVVQQIQALNRLETTTYSVQTVVTVERAGNLIGVGRQRLLVIVHGRVVGGFDLARLRPSDVIVSPDGQAVTLRLPAAEILSNSLDESRTQLYDIQTGLFTRPDPNLILEAQRAGAAEVVRAACADGVLSRATADGQRSLTQLLTLLGFARVEVVAATPPDCPAPGTPVPIAGATPAR